MARQSRRTIRRLTHSTVNHARFSDPQGAAPNILPPGRDRWKGRPGDLFCSGMSSGAVIGESEQGGAKFLLEEVARNCPTSTVGVPTLSLYLQPLCAQGVFEIDQRQPQGSSSMGLVRLGPKEGRQRIVRGWLLPLTAR
jgi:hypothetical protein